MMNHYTILWIRDVGCIFYVRCWGSQMGQPTSGFLRLREISLLYVAFEYFWKTGGKKVILVLWWSLGRYMGTLSRPLCFLLQASHIQQKTKSWFLALMKEKVRSHQYFFGLNVAEIKEKLQRWGELNLKKKVKSQFQLHRINKNGCTFTKMSK